MRPNFDGRGTILDYDRVGGWYNCEGTFEPIESLPRVLGVYGGQSRYSAQFDLAGRNGWAQLFQENKIARNY